MNKFAIWSKHHSHKIFSKHSPKERYVKTVLNTIEKWLMPLGVVLHIKNNFNDTAQMTINLNEYEKKKHEIKDDCSWIK